LPPNCRAYGDMATFVVAYVAFSLSLSLSLSLFPSLSIYLSICLSISFLSHHREYNDLKLDPLSGNKIGFLAVRSDVS